MLKIRQALESAVSSVTPAISTRYENVAFTPTVGVPYQELYLLPSINAHLNIDNADFESLGVFQINLRYPSGTGAKNATDRAELYVSAFKVGSKFVKDDIEVISTSTPRLTILGVDGDRYTVAVSITYKSYYKG